MAASGSASGNIPGAGLYFYDLTGTGIVMAFDSAKKVNVYNGLAVTGLCSATTHKVTQAAGYISSDGSTGYTGTVTTASLVGKTITIKDGIITGFA